MPPLEAKGIIQLFILLVVIFFVSWNLGSFTVTAFPLSLILLGGITIACIVLVNTNLALVILIFSMLLSPEFAVMEVPRRAVVIRLDDVLLVFAFFGWLAKTAINKNLGFLRRTPLNLPIFAYLLICLLSTLIGIQQGRLHVLKASFYILKYLEYPMIFFMVSNSLRSEKQTKQFLFFMLLTYTLVCLCAYSQIGTLRRTTAPFEGEIGEPNTLSGYLVFIMAIISGLYLNAKIRRQKRIYGGLFLLGIPPFLFTLSRTGYVAIVVMGISIGVLSRKKKEIILLGLLLSVIIVPFLLPNPVIDRIRTTFVGPEYEFMGRSMQLEQSAAARIEGWKVVFQRWPQHPLLGFGVSGFPLIDAQYVTTLAEIGAIGFWAFAWMLIIIFRVAMYNYNTYRDNDFVQGLTLGYLAGFVALLAHALTANTFIIVRIMEPFWFMTAIVFMLPKIFYPHQEQEKRPEKFA